MFRCVTFGCDHLAEKIEERPYYLLQCDEFDCGHQVRGEADLDPKSLAETQNTFISTMIKEGWLVGLDRQFCPPHYALRRDRAERLKQMEEEQNKKLVQVATPGQVAAAAQKRNSNARYARPFLRK